MHCGIRRSVAPVLHKSTRFSILVTCKFTPIVPKCLYSLKYLYQQIASSSNISTTFQWSYSNNMFSLNIQFIISLLILSRGRFLILQAICEHYDDVTWTSFSLKSPVTRLCVKQLMWPPVKKYQSLHYWLFVRGIHWPHKGPVTLDDVIIKYINKCVHLEPLVLQVDTETQWPICISQMEKTFITSYINMLTFINVFRHVPFCHVLFCRCFLRVIEGHWHSFIAC